MAKPLTYIGAGAALAASMGLVAWLYILAVGRPFGAWSWTALAFCLVAGLALILATLAAASVSFEPRLVRWRFVGDPLGHGATNPLAIGYQLDLAATRLNNPRPVVSETRWLWLMAVPLCASLALGVALATAEGSSPAIGVIHESEAIATARQTLGEQQDGVQRQFLGLQLSTATDAERRFGDTVAVAMIHPERLVYAVYFAAIGLTQDPARVQTVPGPVVVLDAETGVVLGTGRAIFHNDRQ